MAGISGDHSLPFWPGGETPPGADGGKRQHVVTLIRGPLSFKGHHLAGRERNDGIQENKHFCSSFVTHHHRCWQGHFLLLVERAIPRGRNIE
jgi:hypothetical protein